MDILNTVSLESNTQIIINFDGGDLNCSVFISLRGLRPHPVSGIRWKIIDTKSSTLPLTLGLQQVLRE